MRIAFLGSPPFAQDAFLSLLQGGASGRVHPPVVLVTRPPRKAGRGRREKPNLLEVEARSAGVPVLRPESARDPAFLEAFAAREPDLAVVVSYGQILSEEFLAIPRLGCINLHASLLPRWRGASPIQAAILAGDRETGVCLQHVVRELDAGPVLAARRMPIPPRATSVDLAIALGRLGAGLLVDFLAEIGEGPLPPGEPQDPAAVTVCRRVRREDAGIDWGASAEQVDRLVRAMAGWPVAETRLAVGGALLKIHAGEVEDEEAAGAEPGTVLSAEGGLVVQCGQGLYRVDRLQREGRSAMSAERFLRGARLRPGDRLQSLGQHPPGFLVHF